jgi:hypothetical protein
MSMVNGIDAPPIGINPLVKMLEDVLVQARAGQISSLAMVILTPGGGLATPWAGPQTSDLYMGAGIMQKRIVDTLTQAPRSPIVRVPAGAIG